jgi:isopenicillin N synthase-like dioxygenase
MTHPGGIARILYYPPSNDPRPLSQEEDSEIGIGAHSDYECFTLLLQSNSPGLEILSPDGHWISAEPVEGGIVVNVADFLSECCYSSHQNQLKSRINSDYITNSALDKWSLQKHCASRRQQDAQ